MEEFAPLCNQQAKRLVSEPEWSGELRLTSPGGRHRWVGLRRLPDAGEPDAAALLAPAAPGS